MREKEKSPLQKWGSSFVSSDNLLMICAEKGTKRKKEVEINKYTTQNRLTLFLFSRLNVSQLIMRWDHAQGVNWLKMINLLLGFFLGFLLALKIYCISNIYSYDKRGLVPFWSFFLKNIYYELLN